MARIRTASDCSLSVEFDNAISEEINRQVLSFAAAVEEKGILGALTGGLTSAAGGIAAAVFFGLLIALGFKSKPKR